MNEINVLSAKFRAIAATVLAVLLGGMGFGAYELHQVHAIRKAHATDVAVRAALAEAATSPDLRRIGVTTYDPKHPKFGTTGDNPAGWKIDPTTGDLVAPSGKVLEGLSQKQAVAGTCTSNVASLSGTSVTCDGVTFTAGKRVVLTAQTTTTQNGCMVAASGSWTPCPDLATGSSAAGAFFVSGGSANKGVWLVTNASGSDVVGTNALTFTNVAGGGGAVSSVFTRTGAVTAQTGDYTAAQVGAYANTTTLDAILAPVANVPMSAHKFTGLLLPTNGTTDSASAEYADFYGRAPQNYVRCGSEFSDVTGTVSTSAYTGGMIASVANSGTVTSPTTGNTDQVIGYVTLNRNTTATGIAGIISSLHGTDGCTVELKTSSRAEMDFIIQLPTLSSSAQQFSVMCGMTDGSTHFVKTTIDSQVDAHFIYGAENGASPQSVTSTVTAVAGNWHHGHISKPAGADTATFTVDGAGSSTISTSIPTGTLLYMGCILTGSVGTTNEVANVDAAFVAETYQRAL